MTKETHPDAPARRPAKRTTKRTADPAQSKGARSRLNILAATLACVARYGLAGATHRAIADEAGVPLSLTTYFFSGREDLLEQAFDFFAEQTLSKTQDWLNELTALAKSFPPNALIQPEARTQFHHALTERITEFIVRVSPEHEFGNAVEVSYMFAHQQSRELRRRVDIYREKLVAIISSAMTQVGLRRNDVDASLLLGTIHRLEYDALNRPEGPNRTMIEREVERILALILGEGVE